MSAIPASMPHGPFSPGAGLPPPPSVVMLPCEVYNYLLSVLGLHNTMVYGPKGEAFMSLVRETYHGSPSGGADTEGSPPSPTTAEVVNVTVDEGVAGTPNVPSTPQTSPRASREVLQARQRVFRRWPKAKEGPCPFLKTMSDARLFELDDELRVLREEYLSSIAAGTVSRTSGLPSRDGELHSLEESRSSPDVELDPPDSDKSPRGVEAHAQDPARSPRDDEPSAQDATPPSRDDVALARDATPARDAPPLSPGSEASALEAVSPLHDEIPAQIASPAHDGPFRSPGTLIEEADRAAAEAINGIPSSDLVDAVCDPLSPAPTSTLALSHPSQDVTIQLSSFHPPMENPGVTSGLGAEPQAAEVSGSPSRLSVAALLEEAFEATRVSVDLLHEEMRAVVESLADAAVDRSRGKTLKRSLRPRPEGCTTLFVGNLSLDVDEDALRGFFFDCGEICSVRWLTRADTGSFMGCGFVEFSDPDRSLELAVGKNGCLLLGRPITMDYWQRISDKNAGPVGLPSTPSQESTLPLSSINTSTESSVGTISASVVGSPETSDLVDETAAQDGDRKSREISGALHGALRTLDVTSGLAPNRTTTNGGTLAPDADDWVPGGLPTPEPCSSSKARKRKGKKKKKKKKTPNTHLRFESSDEEESASATLPLSVSVSLSGGVVGSG